MSAKVAAVQSYLEKLSYNFTGVDYFDVRKHRAVGRILDTGQDVTRRALPIKCVEAVFVAIHLTQGLKELERVPFSFRSQVNGITYKRESAGLDLVTCGFAMLLACLSTVCKPKRRRIDTRPVRRHRPGAQAQQQVGLRGPVAKT